MPGNKQKMQRFHLPTSENWIPGRNEFSCCISIGIISMVPLPKACKFDRCLKASYRYSIFWTMQRKILLHITSTLRNLIYENNGNERGLTFSNSILIKDSFTLQVFKQDIIQCGKSFSRGPYYCRTAFFDFLSPMEF